MRQTFLATVLLVGLLLFPQRSRAEDPVAAAQRQEIEESQRRLNAKINALEEALQTYQHDIGALKSEVRALREELARSKNKNENAATDEAIRRLTASIQEVDQKRVADFEKMAAKIRELGKNVAGPGPRSPTPGPRPGLGDPPKGDAPPSREGKGYEYTIRERDTLFDIVKGLKEQGFNITEEQVKQANPNAKWNKLRPGSKIIIPAPAAKP